MQARQSHKSWESWGLGTLMVVAGLGVVMAVWWSKDEVDRLSPPRVEADARLNGGKGEREPTSENPNGLGLRPTVSERDGGEVMTNNPILNPADPDSIPGEYVLMFFSRQDREAFEKAAEARNIRILDRIVSSHALRISAEDRSVLELVLSEAPDPIAWGPNRMVRIPPLAPPPALAAPDEPYVAFGQHAAAWLGMDTVAVDGGKGIRIAVVDTGLMPNWANADVRSVRLSGLDDDVGLHGSLVASIIAGVSGLAPSASLLDIKAMKGDGRGDSFTVARGIVEATDLGAHVINLSLGTSRDCLVLREAVGYAQERGVLLVAAAGNDGTARVAYPAAYEGVLAVGAVDAESRHLFFSNRGVFVDLAAPGAAIDLILNDGQTVPFSGTSASTPFVSAVAALIMQQHPDWGPAKVAAQLKMKSDDAGPPGADILTGAGVLNAARALARDDEPVVDVALMRPWVTPDEMGNAVEIAAQNRGNVAIDRVEMMVRLGKEEQRLFFDRVAVGSTVAHRLRFAADVDSIELDVLVVPVGVRDDRPENNRYRGRVRLRGL